MSTEKFDQEISEQKPTTSEETKGSPALGTGNFKLTIFVIFYLGIFGCVVTKMIVPGGGMFIIGSPCFILLIPPTTIIPFIVLCDSLNTQHIVFLLLLLLTSWFGLFVVVSGVIASV